ncbi:putative Nuak2 protein [Paratrimastix pyriformis]|uniref:Nuak2 protein n=1 Tax=Paratrimastix pyriformis TaxID=342808 RepID=A0ABQ8UFK6_9EUKA|nr:putative Nuak2 protein [Paratrimastix pyriformis]
MAQPTLADWVVLDKLGGGTYGDVSKVRCSQLPNQFFAMKMLKEGIDRAAVRREVEAQLNVNSDNIVKVYLLYEPDGQPPRILMELCDNGDLFHMIDQPRLGALDPQIIGLYFRQLCNALDALSQHGMIHRDLKLENLFLDKDFTLKVGDFGMAKCLAPGQTTMTVCGSPQYMAPEIVSGQGYTAKADIWSAGIILAVLIRRAYPYDGRSAMDNPSFRAFLEPASSVWAEVTKDMGDPRCTDLLRGMLAPDPSARLSIQQVLAHPWVQSLPAPPPEAVKATMSQRQRRRDVLLSRPPRHPQLPGNPQPVAERPEKAPKVVYMSAEEPLPLPALPVLPDEACVTTRFDLVDVSVEALKSRLAACLGSFGQPLGVAWKEASLQAVLEVPSSVEVPSSGQQLEVLLRLNVAKESPKVIVLRVDRLQGDGFLYGGPFLDRVGQGVAEWLTPKDD